MRCGVLSVLSVAVTDRREGREVSAKSPIIPSMHPSHQLSIAAPSPLQSVEKLQEQR
jgi:hypothetical protein